MSSGVAARDQNPAIPKERGGRRLPRNRHRTRCCEGSHLGVEQQRRREERIAGSRPADDQHPTIGEQCRRVVGAWSRHRSRRREPPGRRVVDLGGLGSLTVRVVPTHDQDPAVTQQGRVCEFRSTDIEPVGENVPDSGSNSSADVSVPSWSSPPAINTRPSRRRVAVSPHERPPSAHRATALSARRGRPTEAPWRRTLTPRSFRAASCGSADVQAADRNNALATTAAGGSHVTVLLAMPLPTPAVTRGFLMHGDDLRGLTEVFALS